jgi:OOP family OmpA-OmpF porin
MWLIGAVVLAAAGWCTVPRMVEQRRFDRYVEQLRREPGVVVGSAGREDGRLVVTGLRDPLARDPAALVAASGLDSARLDAKWEPYIALRPEFVVRRAQALLAPATTTTLRLAGDTLVAEGVASASWRREAQRIALAVPGVAVLRLSSLADSATVALRATADSLEQLAIDFPRGSADPSPNQGERLSQLADRLAGLLGSAAAHGHDVRVELVGSADSVGTEEANRVLRRGRATRIRSALIGQGIAPDALLATSDSSSTGSLQRQVRLRIVLSAR